MKQLHENLRSNDLHDLIKPVFEIDAYKSKIGNDEDIIVLSFTLDRNEPASDLENFIEMGFDFVLDADVSPGETDDGVYKVFVEIERTRHAPKQIIEILDGIKKLSGIEDMRFRYFKSFKSEESSIENLTDTVPLDTQSYIESTKHHDLNNYNTFFSNSSADEITLENDTIKFKKPWTEPLDFNIITSGPKQDVYNSIEGPIMLESKDISEVMFFTKYVGNYNITKIGNTFIFENKNWAVALEKK